MSNLEEIVDFLEKDLVPLEISKENFLALRAEERIKSRSQTYDKEFDKLLNFIEKQEFNTVEINKLLKSVKNYSDILLVTYTSLLNEIEMYQKNIFDKFN